MVDCDRGHWRVRMHLDCWLLHWHRCMRGFECRVQVLRLLSALQRLCGIAAGRCVLSLQKRNHWSLSFHQAEAILPCIQQWCLPLILDFVLGSWVLRAGRVGRLGQLGLDVQAPCTIADSTSGECSLLVHEMIAEFVTAALGNLWLRRLSSCACRRVYSDSSEACSAQRCRFPVAFSGAWRCPAGATSWRTCQPSPVWLRCCFRHLLTAAVVMPAVTQPLKS